MDNIFVLKGQLQQVYAKYTLYIEKTIQFVLALITFYLINDNIGYMKGLASPVATLGIAVICTFLPMVMIVFAAAVLILVHLYTVSLGIMGVTAVIFLIIFIFYAKFTPKKSIFILLTLLAFLLKIPYVIPISFALIGTPVYLVPALCGTIIFYMIAQIKTAAAGLKGADASGLLDQISSFIKQVFQNKEMWIIVLAFIICLFSVYAIRRRSADHVWKIAMLSGAVINIVVIAGGDFALNISVSYIMLIIGNVVGVIVALILELLFFSVDYSRGEYLQYEDDEYYYYVKAIPKIVVAAPEKTVKRINSRQETELIDTEQVRRRANDRQPRGRAQGENVRKNAQKRPASQGKSRQMQNEMEKMLLTQSLRDELELDKR